MVSITMRNIGNLLITGCGYVGREVVRAQLRAGVNSHLSIMGTAGSTAGCERIAQLGIVAHLLNLDAAADIPAQPAPWSVLYLVAPPAHGLEDTRIARFLAGLRAPWPGRFVYISTSGVYGDRAGKTVNEEYPPAPATDRARRRLDAEHQLRNWCEDRQVAWIILRVPGIYGPGRLGLSRLARGEPVLRAQDCGPGNRIHRHDLARCCLAALGTQHDNRIFNVCDDEHASSCAFALELARQAGLEAPPQLSLAQAATRFSPMRMSFVMERRRLDNRRMHQQLGVELAYPDIATGIAASLAAIGSDPA